MSATVKNSFSRSNSEKPCTIIRDKKTKAAVLQVNIGLPWKLYAGDSIDTINYSTPLLSGNSSGSFPIPVSNHQRSYFTFDAAGKLFSVAENHLPMTGGYNFRDLGGIKTKKGKSIVWGTLIRSDELRNLDKEDLEYLASIPLTSIIDFRSNNEINHAPDKLPASLKYYLPLSIMPGSLNIEEIEEALEKKVFAGANKFMLNVYEKFVTDEKIQQTYRQFFKYLENKDNLPLLFHCTAGKDRTGFATVLLLFALGVDEETIIEDYLSSGTYLQGKYPEGVDIFTVKPEFLQAAVNKINADYTSIENYLKEVLQVDIGKLRRLYLE